MKPIKYNKEFVDFMNKITLINKSVVFEKHEDKLMLKRKDEEESMVYFLETTKDKFDFNGDKIAIYDYSEFYQIFKIYNEPEITMEDDGDVLKIKKNKSVINYKLQDPEIIEGSSISNPSFGKSVADIILSEDDIKEIKKMKSILKSDYINLKIDEKLNLKCFSSDHDNDWENEYDLKNKDDGVNIDINILSSVVDKIPTMKYILSINEDNIVRFITKKEDIKLTIYTSEVE